MPQLKKFFLYLAAGVLLTVLTAPLPGNHLLVNIAPITLSQNTSSGVEEDQQSACLSMLIFVKAYGSPLRMYEHVEFSDGCGTWDGSPARIFPASIIGNILFWAILVFGGSVLVAKWRKRSIQPSSAAVLSQLQRTTNIPAKPRNLRLLYILLGGILGAGFCLSFTLFASDLVMYRTDSLIMPLGLGEALSAVVRSQSTWIMIACGGLLGLLVALRKRLQATASANWSILLPVAASMFLQLPVLISGLSRTQRAAGPYDLATINTWLVGWAWTFLVYLVWVVVMIVLVAKSVTSNKQR